MKMAVAKVKAILSEGVRKDGLWAVAFVGICVMVALGKLKPETIEFMLFALLGKQSERGKKENTNENAS
jgi:hypothetical protein